MRDVLVVPETKSVLDHIYHDFKQRRRHMAVVVDEFGSVVRIGNGRGCNRAADRGSWTMSSTRLRFRC